LIPLPVDSGVIEAARSVVGLTFSFFTATFFFAISSSDESIASSTTGALRFLVMILGGIVVGRLEGADGGVEQTAARGSAK
jgi:hypothetical protein